MRQVTVKILRLEIGTSVYWMGLLLLLLLCNSRVVAQQTLYPVITQVDAHDITASASSTFSPQQNPVNLINGSGLGLPGDRHDEDMGASSMWHTLSGQPASAPAKGLPALKAWVRFDFKSPEDINKLQLWNHNQAGLTNRGFKSTEIWGSPDGIHWKTLGRLELPDEKTLDGKATDFRFAAEKPLKAIIIGAYSNWGGDVYGLSEIKFLYEHQVDASALPFPETVKCTPTSIYRFCKNGAPGRAVLLDFRGNKLYQSAIITVKAEGGTEISQLPYAAAGRSQVEVILPSGVGVDREARINVEIKAGARQLNQSFILAPQRQWTVYIYPHSHVDIGYTNTQANVEIIHQRNLMEGMRLARQTADYPKDARYLWNPEVIWPVERYLKNASPEEKANLIDAIQKGFIHLDAGYVNANTSLASGEELYRLFSDAKRLEIMTGVPIRTMTQTDIPGMSWGIVPLAAQLGIKYIFAPFNGSGRIGLADRINFRPFWWIGQDGASKVLFLQPGDYTPGAKAKGYKYWPLMAGQKDPDKLIRVVRTNHPRENFIDDYLWPKLSELEADSAYPYNIFPMTWAMADNTPIDADLPRAVKSWNEQYAYPHLVIASATQIMSAFDSAYGDIIPEFRGDFTEYWTDGAGTAARETAINRHTKEALIQADVLWSMLHRAGKPLGRPPVKQMSEAWRNVVMGSEHTWSYMNPEQTEMQDEIFKVKQSFFTSAQKSSEQLLAHALAPIRAEKSSLIAVINTLAWKRSGLITLSEAQSEGFNAVSSLQGEPVASQRLSTGELVFCARDIPGFGVVNYRLVVNKEIHSGGNIVKGYTLDNHWVKVSIDSVTGDVISLRDKTGAEFVNLADPARMNSFRYLPGSEHAASAGQPQYATELPPGTVAKDEISNRARSVPAGSATGPAGVRVKITENGPVLGAVEVRSGAEGCDSLVREIRVTAGSPEVELNNTVYKIAVTKKEGVHFGFAFNIPGGRVHYDVPWSVVELEKDQLPVANKNWIAFQRWVDISGKNKGVTWCSLDAPLFESGTMSANIIGDGYHSPAWIEKLPQSATLYSWALNNHWYTNFPLSQKGKLQFNYRILPHGYGYDAVKANRFGLEKAQPLMAVVASKSVEVDPIVTLDNDKVFIANLKTTTDGNSLIIHLRSVSDQKQQVNLSFRDFNSASVRTFPADAGPGVDINGPVTILPYGMLSLIVGRMRK